MIRPTLDQVIIMFDIKLWHVLIAFLVYGVHDFVIYFLATWWTRHYMNAHELPYLYDENLSKVIKERNDLKEENKKLNAEIHEYFKKTEGAKVALGVERGSDDQ